MWTSFLFNQDYRDVCSAMTKILIRSRSLIVLAKSWQQLSAIFCFELQQPKLGPNSLCNGGAVRSKLVKLDVTKATERCWKRRGKFR